MRKESPELQKASLYLEKMLSDYLPEDRLPSIKELSRLAGVADSTMSKALGKLRDLGFLSIKPGLGIYVTKPFHPSSMKGSYKMDNRRFKRVEQALFDDILHGNLSSTDHLPLLKELTYRYGTSYSTLKQAIDSLVRKSVLLPLKKGFHLNRTEDSSGNRCIIVISPVIQFGLLSTYTSRSTELFRYLETECNRFHVTLEFIFIPDALDRPNLLSDSSLYSSLNAGKQIIGYLYYSVPGYHNSQSNYEQILQLIATLKKPCAILDEHSGNVLPRFLLQNRFIRTFSITDNLTAGQETAQYLFMLGHRKMCFFSHIDDAHWSIDRLSGISDLCAADKTQLSVFCCQSNHRHNEVFNNEWEKLRINELFSGGLEDYETDLMQFLEKNLIKVRTPMNELLWYRLMYHEIHSLFKDALIKCSDHTAWICVNDMLALLAKIFLERHNISIPGKISLISFDDTLEAFNEGITSYNFNMFGASAACLNHLLRFSEMEPFTRGINPVNAKGWLMKRQSTALG